MSASLIAKKLKQNYAASLVQAKILVVDDQPINIQLINQTLSQDYNVYMATSGKQAIDFCLNNQPDLVLMDVVMPEMDGLETCRQMKEMEELATIPVIFVTGLTEQDEEDECWEAGGIDFLTKPVNPVTLRNRVKAQLTLKFQTDWLRDLAYFDGLTGVYNRRYFDDYYLRQINHSKRCNQPLSLMMIDIDFFKQYNDNYGHLSGDDCLVMIADCLQSVFQRPSDIIARFGGEEFVAVLPDTEVEGVKLLAQKTIEKVQSLNIEHNHSPFGIITISIGIAHKSGNDLDDSPLTLKADQQLYKAKANGRNTFMGPG
ncbi:diguanylate cyclase [Neptunicella marina]|uniref:diguanylate cyclase n=1 Tax=Neptunicella marina TaxID=2125989 RepID=A0A8J6M3C5_9ALTE|nr:diguanylate cyclase [Neptunicella marina]MBC3766867.1 diguanylate cyclase [Neptunicella marina]